MKKIITAVLLILLICFSVNAEEKIKIAFIDTGISTKYINEENVADGKNYVFETNDTTDRIGHGTATAGMVIGSKRLGILGSCNTAVAVPLVIYDTYPSGVVKNGGIEAMCKAIYDAVDVYGCRVINISMGIPAQSKELEKAAEYAEKKGCVVVSAVGNDNLTFPDRTYYPAALRTVIGVGASDGENVYDGSQRSGVDVLAEGKNIKTVTIRNAAETENRIGTSYSCAYVSGLCAEIIADCPNISPSQVRTLLYAGASDIDMPDFDKSSGWGIVKSDDWTNQPTSRAVLCTLIYIAENQPQTKSSQFEDVQPDSFCISASAWSAENGIFNGVGKNIFEPEGSVTRAQAAAVLRRSAQYKGVNTDFTYDISGFGDDKEIPNCFLNDMKWSVKNGITVGHENNTLAPNDTVSRSEIKLMLSRVFKLINNY